MGDVLRALLQRAVLGSQPLSWLYRPFGHLRATLRYRRAARDLLEAYRVRVGTGRSRVFLMLRQCHSNLGDVALGMADEQFVRDHVPCSDIFTIYERDYEFLRLFMLRSVRASDLFVLIGGGSLGDEYLSHERHRRDVVSSFGENRVISFPQTMFFSDTESGRQELERTREVYSRHRDLHVFAREVRSFEMMRRAFPANDVQLAPDMVLYLERTRQRGRRQGIMVCLRTDRESILDAESRERIVRACSRWKAKVWLSSIHGSRYIPHENRETEVEAKLSEIASAELIITDTLHGMIFATITSTRCIALSNYNHKIEGTYRWIQHLPWVRHVDDASHVEALIPELLSLEVPEYRNGLAAEHYQKITDLMNENTRRGPGWS